MKFNRILLIIPTYPNSHYSGRGVRLRAGIGYISETLTKNNIENIVIDMELGYSPDDLYKKIRGFNPDLIGIRMMTFRYKYNYSILTVLKERFPSIKIIAGGPHVSTLRKKVLDECKAIDYGCVLEGERTIIELCEGKVPDEEIKGLLIRKGEHDKTNNENGEILFTGERKFIEDLDSIPFPTFSQFELDKYPKELDIVTSRGCPYQCTYCPVNVAIGKMFRYRSAKSLVDELEYWYARGFKTFEFVDDNFTLIRKRVFEICDEIEKRGLKELKLSCGNGVRADRVDREMLQRMKDVGFYLLAFGVESGSEKVLKNIKKGEKLAKIEDGIKAACELDYIVELFFIIGSPGETYEDAKKSFALALKYPVTSANFYNLIPFLNTELYRWLEKNNYLLYKPDEYLSDASSWTNKPIFETPDLSVKERMELIDYATGPLQKKIKRNYALYKFQQRGFPHLFALSAAILYSSKIYGIFIKNRAVNSFVQTLRRTIFKTEQ